MADLHTPWRIGTAADRELEGLALTVYGEVVADPSASSIHSEVAPLCIERAVLCVNACVGMSDRELREMECGELDHRNRVYLSIMGRGFRQYGFDRRNERQSFFEELFGYLHSNAATIGLDLLVLLIMASLIWIAILAPSMLEQVWGGIQ